LYASVFVHVWFFIFSSFKPDTENNAKFDVYLSENQTENRQKYRLTRNKYLCRRSVICSDQCNRCRQTCRHWY